MTQTELEQLCREWQEILSLRDWDVKPSIKRGRDFASSGNEAEINWELQTRTATIYILDPIDYPDDTKWEQDIESSLVHELLHIYFAPFNATDGTLEKVAQEQAINAISLALVKLKRGNCG